MALPIPKSLPNPMGEVGKLEVGKGGMVRLGPAKDIPYLSIDQEGLPVKLISAEGLAVWSNALLLAAASKFVRQSMLEGQSVNDEDCLTVLTDISTEHLTQLCHFVTTGRLYAAKLDPLLVGSFANLGIDLNSLSFEQVPVVKFERPHVDVTASSWPGHLLVGNEEEEEMLQQGPRKKRARKLKVKVKEPPMPEGGDEDDDVAGDADYVDVIIKKEDRSDDDNDPDQGYEDEDEYRPSSE